MPSIKKNIIYSLLLTTSQVGFALIILPYISRILGPVGIGRVSFVDSNTQYFIICASLGIPIYGIREVAKIKNDKLALSKLFSELMLIMLTATALLLLIYWGLIFMLNKFYADKNLFLLGLLQLFISTFICEWFFQGLENFRFISIRTFVVRLVSTILILVFVKTKSDVFIYYSILTITLGVNGVLNIFAFSKITSFTLTGLNFLKHLKPVFTFFITRFVTSIYVVFLTIILGFVASKQSVAYFSSAYKIYTVILTFIIAFSSVLIPRLSDYVNRDKHQEGMELLLKAFNVIFACGIPVVTGVMFFSKPIVLIILGTQFKDAQTDLILLAPLIFIISISNLLAMNVLTPRNKENLFLRATIAGMFVSLVLMFLLMPKFQDTGAAITLLITEIVVCAALIYFSFNYISTLPFNKKNIILSLINAIIIFGFGSRTIDLISLPLFYRFILSGAGSFVIFILIELFIIKDELLISLIALVSLKLKKARS